MTQGAFSNEYRNITLSNASFKKKTVVNRLGKSPTLMRYKRLLETNKQNE